MWGKCTSSLTNDQNMNILRVSSQSCSNKSRFGSKILFSNHKPLKHQFYLWFMKFSSLRGDLEILIDNMLIKHEINDY